MTTDTPDGNSIATLLAERAIREVVLRYARGIDRVDLEMVRSCYWPDATDYHGTFTGTRDEFVDWVGTVLQRQTMTMHNLANVMIELDGDTAGVETYGVAYHAGEPAGDIRWNFAAGFRYVDRFERRSGEWRIADRLTVIEWVAPWQDDAGRRAKFGEPLARRFDGTDPVYTATTNRAR